MKLAKSAYMILALLSQEKMSGYDIKSIAAKIANFYWSESNSQIYPTLKRLEENGLVSSTLDESSGARQRRVFSITKQGKEVLNEWLRQDTELTPYREEILLKISSLTKLPKKDRLKTINSYRDSVSNKLEDLKENEDHILNEHDDHPLQASFLLKHEHAKMILEAKLKWADKAIKLLS